MSIRKADTSTSPPAKRFRHQQVKSVEHLYLSTKCADVYFSFASRDGTVTRVPAHTNLLGADSDEFDRIFYGELREIGDICVTDVSEAAFREFLQFFYLSDFKISAEHIADVMHLGHKYQMKACVDTCAKFLKVNLTDENICTALSLGIQCDEMELVKTCEARIMLNTATILASAEFLECDKKSLEYILKMNMLSCSEVEVFEACMSWVRAKSKQNTVTMDLVETHLGKLYHHIRFTSMTIQEFCKLSIDYHPVLSRDYETITKMIVIPEENLLTLFNKKPRHAEWNPDAIVKCDRAMSQDQMRVNSDAKNQTTFSTNKPLLFGEFMCGKIGVVRGDTPDAPHTRDVRSSFPIDVEITESHDANTKHLLEMKAQLQSKETNILLPHPILIRPGFFYTISIERFPGDHCFYSKELKKVMRLESDIIIEFHNCYIGTKSKKVRGLIPNLNFNRIN